MSAILNTKRVVERRLSLNFPTTKISFENSNFVAPKELYLRTAFRVNRPTDDSIGNNCYLENITFTVFVCDELNKGTANAITVAEQVRDLFYKRLSLLEDGTRVHILRQPQVSTAGITTDRLIIPVVISLTVEAE